MRFLILLLLPLLTSCSISSLYPTLGATAGGASGAVVGGPGGAALGAFGGAALGEVLKSGSSTKDMQAQLDEANAVVEAVSEGDVSKLIAKASAEQQSWFDKVIEGIYDVLVILAVGAILIIAVPMLYTKFHIKKLKAKE